LPPSLAALGEGSHGSILNGNYAPNRLSSAWKPTYMNSPHGLVVLAHRDYDEVVEGVHPASISNSIETPKNIVEPLAGDDGTAFNLNPVAYNSHWLTRRSQGGLVLAAFGRMIDGGDDAAPRFIAHKDSTLEMSIHDTPDGPVFFVFSCHEENADIVHVIHPAHKEAA
ncbi:MULTISPECIES: hypothetical protein, partial [unclassified Rhizobium]|uniref:hypothetical protein n=2 Tax=unclassified Rhizobium TaxID=2613769 RepID=UPI001ADB83DB